MYLVSLRVPGFPTPLFLTSSLYVHKSSNLIMSTLIKFNLDFSLVMLSGGRLVEFDLRTYKI